MFFMYFFNIFLSNFSLFCCSINVSSMICGYDVLSFYVSYTMDHPDFTVANFMEKYQKILLNLLTSVVK